MLRPADFRVANNCQEDRSVLATQLTRPGQKRLRSIVRFIDIISMVERRNDDTLLPHLVARDRPRSS